MRFLAALVSSLCLLTPSYASPYRDDLTAYNLNVNQNAQDPTQYATTRSNKTYTPSPQNWRSIPFYTVLMDKFADGDPSNNQYFNSRYEWDWRETQLRFGGDLKGLTTKLDYIQGMGMKGIYLSGTIFVNMIWQADSTIPIFFISSFLSFYSHPFLQVILLLTSQSWILTGVLLMIGLLSSTPYTHGACTSCWILPSERCPTFSVSKGMRNHSILNFAQPLTVNVAQIPQCQRSLHTQRI